MINAVGHFIHQHSMHNQDYHSSFQLSFTRGRPDLLPVLCIESAHYAQWNLSPALCTFPQPAKSKKNYFNGFCFCICVCVFGLFPLLKSSPTWPLIQLCQIETVPTGQNQFDSVDEKYPDQKWSQMSYKVNSRKRYLHVALTYPNNLPSLGGTDARWEQLLELCPAYLVWQNMSKNSFLGTMFANDNHLEV